MIEHDGQQPSTSLTTVPVSVVIPTYNREDMVVTAVRSALTQEPAPREVIVVDDASQDRTAEAAEAAGATVVRMPQNAGEGGARTAGVVAATCEWVAFLDSDDEWLPGHLALVWAAREGHLLVASSGMGRPSGRFNGNPTGKPLVLADPTPLFWPDNPIGPSGVLAAREAVLAAGGFSARPLAADLAAWAQILEHGTAVVLPQVGWIYNEHEGQVSLDRRGMYLSVWALLEEQRNRPWVTARLRQHVAVQQSWDLFRAALAAGDRPSTGRALLRLLRHPIWPVSLPGLLRRRAAVRRASVSL